MAKPALRSLLRAISIVLLAPLMIVVFSIYAAIFGSMWLFLNVVFFLMSCCEFALTGDWEFEIWRGFN